MSAKPETNPSDAARPWYVDEDGFISTVSADARLRFGFIVANVPYEALLFAKGNQPTLLVSADVAPMPYSAESTTARNALFSLVNRSQNQSWGTCGLSPQQRITVAGEVAIDHPINPLTLVGAAVRFVLQSGSFIRSVQQEAQMQGVVAA